MIYLLESISHLYSPVPKPDDFLACTAHPCLYIVYTGRVIVAYNLVFCDNLALKFIQGQKLDSKIYYYKLQNRPKNIFSSQKCTLKKWHIPYPIMWKLPPSPSPPPPRAFCTVKNHLIWLQTVI